MNQPDDGTFGRYVREALAHLHDRPYLQTHPIRFCLSVSGELTAEEINRLILAAINQLRPLGSLPSHAPEWRSYRCLALRYAEGMTPEKVAAELGLSERQARRLHQDALDRFADLLWRQYGAPVAAKLTRRASDRPGESFGEDTGRVNEPGFEVEAAAAWVEARHTNGRADLAETFDTALETIAPLAAQCAARISHSVPGGLPEVAVERAILRQILLLLLAYAVRSWNGCPVGVTARRSDLGRLVVEFDVGGNPESQPAMEGPPPLRQAPDIEALLESAIDLVRLYDGSVDGAIAPGQAGVIRIDLPAVRSTAVLVVDDNPGVPRLFRRYLQGTDFRVLEASTASGAIALARETRPDVVILDVILPTQDGWEVLQQLRHDDATRDIPIVICSVLPGQSLALALGVTDYLPKPVTRQGLLAKLKRYAPTEPAASRAPP